MIKQSDLKDHDYDLLGQAYHNLIEAGLVIAVTEYDDFVRAIFTVYEEEEE